MGCRAKAPVQWAEIQIVLRGGYPVDHGNGVLIQEIAEEGNGQMIEVDLRLGMNRVATGMFTIARVLRGNDTIVGGTRSRA